MFKLDDLLANLEVIEVKNHWPNVTINGIAYHSAKVSKGNVFVCIKGYKTDGHKYLDSAVKNGAVAAIVEEFQENIPVPQYLVTNCRIALAQLGSAFYDNPSEKLKMIGITATNGKTTTSYMVNAILENHYKTGLIGTVVVKIDEESFPAQLTTPESLDLQNYLHQMVDKGVTHTTMEVSSSALETHRVEGVNYDIVTLNNISKEHIDTHGSFERYFEVKSSLITNASEKCTAILNLDCAYSASLLDKTKATTITYSLNSKEGNIYCKNLDMSTGRGKFTFEIIKPFKVGNKLIDVTEFAVELAVPGLHSVYNALVAITVGLICEIPVTTIKETLKSFRGVERRFQFVYEGDIKVLDDHFANPGNINVTLGTLQKMDYNNLQIVYAIRGQRGVTVNRENAETIVDWANKLRFNEIIATKSVSHVTDKDKVTEEELAVFMEVMKKNNIKVHLFDELPDAVSFGISKLSSGDLMLLAGCQGMDYGAEIALPILRERDESGKEPMHLSLD